MGAMKMKAMKAMGAMKAMKALKAMKKRVSKIGKKFLVFKGKKVKTVGGLKKEHLVKSKSGKIVSKKKSLHGKKIYKRIAKWTGAVQKARKALGLKGFVAIKKGTAFYKKAMSFYK